MKKIILISFLLFHAVDICSQPSFNLFSGYGKTAFKNVNNQKEYLPVGAQLMFGVPIFNFGIEASYNITPIIYDIQDIYIKKNLKEIKLNQLFVGSIVKIKLTKGGLIPYLRAGTGLYTGKELVVLTEEEKRKAKENGIILEDYKISLKNKLGFNFGGGLNLVLDRYNGLFFEYVYHFISRRENIPGGILFKADNWTFLLGYMINFL